MTHSVDDLMKFIKGPDFPTGAIILQDPQGKAYHRSTAAERARLLFRPGLTGRDGTG